MERKGIHARPWFAAIVAAIASCRLPASVRGRGADAGMTVIDNRGFELASSPDRLQPLAVLNYPATARTLTTDR